MSLKFVSGLPHLKTVKGGVWICSSMKFILPWICFFKAEGSDFLLTAHKKPKLWLTSLTLVNQAAFWLKWKHTSEADQAFLECGRKRSAGTSPVWWGRDRFFCVESPTPSLVWVVLSCVGKGMWALEVPEVVVVSVTGELGPLGKQI